MGTSLGTTTTVHLATTRAVKAVILQGAFLSALRVVCPFRRRISKLDQYENIEKVGKITVPTLFVHGRKDTLFRLRHAKMLHRHCPGAADVEPAFVEGAGHLTFDLINLYWMRLHKFLHRELVST